MPISRGGGGFGPPAAPVTGGGGGAFDIEWDAATGATGYRVYWDTIPGPPYANSHDAGSALGVDYADLSGIGTGLRYFNVRSYDESTLLGPWGTEFSRTLA